MSDQHSLEIHRRFAVALAASEQMGHIAMRLYQSDAMTTTRKADGSVVTPADKDAETLLREMIASNPATPAFAGSSIPSMARAVSLMAFPLSPILSPSSLQAGPSRALPTFPHLVSACGRAQMTAHTGAADKACAPLASHPR